MAKSKFADDYDAGSWGGVPKPPQQCTNGTCQRPAVLLVARVTNAAGKLHAGAYSEFGHVDRKGGGARFVLHQGWAWHSWLARCADCYLKDVDSYAQRPKVA